MQNNPPTRLSALIDEEENRRLGKHPKKNEIPLPLTNAGYVGRLVSKPSTTWLTKAVKCVENAIHEFWSSIIFAHATRMTLSLNSSATDTVGDQNDYELKFGNVVSFAQTAIDFILLNNWSTMPIRMSSQHSGESMSDTISENRTTEIIDGLEAGTLDYNTVTMAEWLQVSFLMLYHGQETHVEQKVTYGGAVYKLHACVAAVNPAIGDTKKLEAKQ